MSYLEIARRLGGGQSKQEQPQYALNAFNVLSPTVEDPDPGPVASDQAAPRSTVEDAAIEHEAMALASELVLIADRLHRQAELPLGTAEALLATFKAKIATWRTWYMEHAPYAPEALAEVDAALCRQVRHLRRLHRPAQEVPCEPF